VEERREIVTAADGRRLEVRIVGPEGGVPVSIWQGRDDRFVPITHGEWLADHVPGARSHLLESEGHTSLSRHRYGDVLDELTG
jgi:pimeloyl-ACP methyl ester carboxylesterase